MTRVDNEEDNLVYWNPVPSPIRISDLPMLAHCPSFFVFRMIEQGRVQPPEKARVSERVSRRLANNLRRIL